MFLSCKRRVFSALLSVIIIATVAFSSQASYSSEPYFTENSGGAVISSYFKSGDPVATAEEWKTNPGSNSSIILYSNDVALRVSSRKNSSGVVTSFDKSPECTDYAELGIFIRMLTPNCTVSLSVKYDRGRSEVTADIIPGEEYYVFAPIPANADKIEKISVTVDCTDPETDDESAIKSSFILRKAVITQMDHTELGNKYSAFHIDGIDEDMTISGNATVTAYPVMFRGNGDNYAIRVSLRGRGSGVTVFYASDGETFSVCGSDVITEGRSTYIFPVGELTGIAAYKLEFTGTKDSAVKLDGVDFIQIKNFETANQIGTVSKCFYSNGILSVEGSITRDAAVEYIDGQLCLYEIPMWGDLDTAIYGDPVESMKMSTSFSFTHNLSSDHSVFTAYVVAVRLDGEVIPLSDPMYPSRSTSSKVSGSTSTVYGISPEDAFAAGFDNYIIEIDTAEFFQKNGGQGGTVFTHDGGSYYPNRESVTDIDKKVQFLSSAGIGVIFRISDSDTSGYDPTVEAQCRTLAAAVRYLTDKYSPTGFIAECATEVAGNSGLTDQAENTASIIRLVSAAGRNAVSYIEIDSNGECETLAWLISRFMSTMPRSNWEIVLTNITKNTIYIADAVASAAVDSGYSSNITVCAKSAGKGVTQLLGAITAKANRSYVIYITDGDVTGISTDSWENYEADTDVSGLDAANTVTLWDFTSSYDSGGFTVPAGPTGIFTGNSDRLAEYMDLQICRSLKTILGGGSEMIIAQPPAPMRLTDCPKVKFLLEGETNSPFSIDIVFVSGNERAVFTAKFDESGVYTTVCDLSETGISNRVERIAIILHSGGPVEFGIASVTATGTKPTAELEKTVYITSAPSDVSPASEDNSIFSSRQMFYVIIGAIAFVTVIVFSALSIKKQK